MKGVPIKMPDEAGLRLKIESVGVNNTAIHYDVGNTVVCGWARKICLPRKNYRHREINASLSDRQQAIMIGSLLGDSHSKQPV